MLSHILGSNPEICGYSELYLPYKTRKDLIRMRLRLYHDLRCRLKDKYLLDKLLHNRCSISDTVHEVAKPKVFLLRDPENTLKSIIHMGNLTGSNRDKDPTRASGYYCSRLLHLEEQSKTLKSDSFFLEWNDLANDMDQILTRLTKWLELDKPLRKEYAIFPNTGKPKYGDSSDNIRSGTIKKTGDYPDIIVPPEYLQKATASYANCRASLFKTIS